MSKRKVKPLPLLAQLRAILSDRDFKACGANGYEYQEHRGDKTIVRILGNERVRITVRCWNLSDGWSDDTMTARQALAHFSI